MECPLGALRLRFIFFSRLTCWRLKFYSQIPESENQISINAGFSISLRNSASVKVSPIKGRMTSKATSSYDLPAIANESGAGRLGTARLMRA